MLNCQFSLKYSVYKLPQNNMRNNKFKIRQYIKKNWGSPFIVGFMFLLIVAAIFLSLSLQSLADTIVVYGFYILVSGVFLQLVCFLKYPHKDKGETI